jgi:hypothetical protein
MVSMDEISVPMNQEIGDSHLNKMIEHASVEKEAHNGNEILMINQLQKTLA